VTLLPAARVGKVAAAVWSVACVGVLLFAYVGRDIRDTDIVVLVALLVLGFPVSLALSAILTGIFYLLDAWWGVVVPGGFSSNLFAWVLFVAAGYMQWRLIVPHVFARKEHVI
jgi:riboflavin transporter FmnP